MNNICASTARALRSSAHPAARARCLRPTNPQSRSVSCLNKSRIIPSRHIRHFHASNELLQSSPKPSSTYRGPPSEEETQTDFGGLNVLGSSTGPTTGIDACHQDGFLLNSGLKIVGGSGCFLLNGDAFSWRPWDAAGRRPALLNAKGQWDVDNSVWGLLDLVWPKPDLLILGIGPSMGPISPQTRAFINSLGVRIEVQDTGNAAAQFNLLATERGVGNVAAALIPIGWKEPR